MNGVQEAGLVLALLRVIVVHLERILCIIDSDQVRVAVAIDVTDGHELHADAI